ncbi:hypothetical protein QO189_07555 [Psychrobacter sp. Arc29]|uniref:hypothetical protein n=1 Tax=Psychrobacter sp. Arc29 TaxID=3046690 RepID=UPI00352C10BF
MSYQNQAGWEWIAQEQERWELEQQALIETHQTSPTKQQQVNERMLADFDSIFMNEGE